MERSKISCVDIAHFAIAQQIDVHEASLCVLLVFEILWSSTNLIFVVARMVCFPCVWLCFICVSFEFTLGSCVFTFEFMLLSSSWWTQNGFKWWAICLGRIVLTENYPCPYPETGLANHCSLFWYAKTVLKSFHRVVSHITTFLIVQHFPSKYTDYIL